MSDTVDDPERQDSSSLFDIVSESFCKMHSPSDCGCEPLFKGSDRRSEVHSPNCGGCELSKDSDCRSHLGGRGWATGTEVGLETLSNWVRDTYPCDPFIVRSTLWGGGEELVGWQGCLL